MCACTWQKSQVFSPWLGSHSCRQTDRQADLVRGYISTHAKCYLTEWEAGLVVMLTSPPGRQTDKQSHGSSLQLSAVCCTLCVWRRKVNAATGFGRYVFVWLATFTFLKYITKAHKYVMIPSILSGCVYCSWSLLGLSDNTRNTISHLNNLHIGPCDMQNASRENINFTYNMACKTWKLVRGTCGFQMFTKSQMRTTFLTLWRTASCYHFPFNLWSLYELPTGSPSATTVI